MKFINISICFLLSIIFICELVLFSSESKAGKVRISLKTDRNSLDEANEEINQFTLNSGDSCYVENENNLEEIVTVSMIRFSGYEKEANSSHETFIITNETPVNITSILLEIEYLDMKGRMLHKRKVPLEEIIPSMESRKVDIKSWDKQHTYYYYRGNAPKKIATPYDVKISSISFDFIP